MDKIKKQIQQVFDIWQGHQITDEEIYNSNNGKYPILTGHNIIKGYSDSPIITDVPCITIPSKGIINKLYLQNRPFDANNTIALIPKNREEVDLEYVIFTQSSKITQFISSINTNNYLNNEILKGIEIDCPDYKIQLKIKLQYRKLIEIKELLKASEIKISNQIKKSVLTEGVKVLMDVFDLMVGSDDEMTEKYAYNNNGNVPIYSGASKNNGILNYTNKSDFDYDEYITWSLSGKAGTMFLRKTPCCLTRDCGIMVPKNKDDINLEWFIFTQESGLKDLAIGDGGLGRLKKNLIESYQFIRPNKNKQDEIVAEYKKLIVLKQQLNSIILKIENQLQKSIS